MRLEHHLVGGYVRYISPHIIIIIIKPIIWIPGVVHGSWTLMAAYFKFPGEIKSE